MNKVVRLVRVQLWAVLGDMLSIGNNKTNKKPKTLYVGVALFTLLFSALSFFYSYMIGTGLKMFHSLELLPAMMMSVTSIMLLMTTVFKVKGTIFGFRDYDLIMSLPVSTSKIVASRLTILYAINFVFVIIIMLPATLAYGMIANPGPIFYLLNMIMIFFIPMVPIVAASILGTVIAYAASKFRYSNVLNIIFSMILLLGFMGMSLLMGGTSEEFVNISRALTDQVNGLYPLAKMYTKAATEYDISSFLMFVGVSLIAFLFYSIIVGKVFKKMNTLMMTGRSHTQYKMGSLKASSPLKALYIKELKRFFASPAYVLNTAFGIALLTLGAIAMQFTDLSDVFNQEGSFIFNSGPVFLVFCVLMSSTTMASISLEGRNLWIIKSLPVPVKTIFLSKVAVNLTIVAPALLDAILIGIALDMDVLSIAYTLLIVSACSVFVALFGLLINLMVPNFNWTTEAVVVKQSAASLIVVFTGMGITGILFLFIILSPSVYVSYLGYAVLIVLLDLLIYRILMTTGVKRFQKL